MTIYLVDEPFIDIAVSYAKDKSARIVLIQDAVYASATVHAPGEVCVIKDDVARRGLQSRIPPGISVIDYDELVRMMETEKVVNFL